jgi:hypothetical protein
MMLGLFDHVLSYDEILQERLFPSLIELPPHWQKYYGRLVETPVLGVNRRHEPKYAF